VKNACYNRYHELEAYIGIAKFYGRPLTIFIVKAEFILFYNEIICNT
jgi:hypothetical protein